MKIFNQMKDLDYILTHLGENHEDYFHAVSPPIIQSSNFTYNTIESLRNAFRDEVNTPLYTRGTNPTVSILRKKIASLEKAEDALVFSSGSAACSAALIANVQAGDHVICVEKPYSWTYKLITQFLSRFGVSYTFVDGKEIQNFEKAIQNNTKVIYLESPNSLTFELQDLAACAQLAKKHGIITICDNSYSSPLNQNPISLGIDIVTHSATKYLNGHSDVVVGVLCSTKEMIKKIFYSEYMTLGTNISPHDAWLVLRGMRTLDIRLEKSQNNALQVVQFLENHPKVAKLIYPFSTTHPQYELARKQMRGSGGLFSVEFHCNDQKKMELFCESMAEVFLMAVSWGGYESLQVPAVSFYQVHPGETPSLPFTMVRYYCGLENPERMIACFEKSLKLL